MGELLQPDRMTVTIGVLALLAALAYCCWSLDREWVAHRRRRDARRLTAYILAGRTPRARHVRQIEVLNRLQDGTDTSDLTHERH